MPSTDNFVDTFLFAYIYMLYIYILCSQSPKVGSVLFLNKTY